MAVCFKNRTDAGRRLALALEKFKDTHALILALPRGGVPLGYEIARHLNAGLDILLVRKIGAPESPELAAGAVVDGDDPQLVLNENIVRLYNIPQTYIDSRMKQQLAEIERRRALYCAGRPSADIAGKTVIVVDDGIATGATARAALRALRRRKPARLVLAVPVASPDALDDLAGEADEIVCLEKPSVLFSIGEFYRDFEQVPDSVVVDFLKQSA